MLIESINYKDLWINLSKTKYIRVGKINRAYYPANLKGKKLVCRPLYTYKTYSNVKPNIMFQYVYDTATKVWRTKEGSFLKKNLPPKPIIDIDPFICTPPVRDED